MAFKTTEIDQKVMEAAKKSTAWIREKFKHEPEEVMQAAKVLIEVTTPLIEQGILSGRAVIRAMVLLSDAVEQSLPEVEAELRRQQEGML